MVDFCVDNNVNFVTTSAGDPSKYIKVLKDADITVYHAVPNLQGALKAYDAGVDGLVVEGTEGGGFKGYEEIGLTVLIQAIKNEIDLPIIAAGGIVNGIGMASAFAAGAEAIQMGTRFVSSIESPVHDNFKNSIKSAGTDGTYILNKSSKPVIRALKTELTKDIFEKGSMSMGDLAKIKDLYFGGDMNAAPALAGQSSGLINEIKSVKTIIDETISEYNFWNVTTVKKGGTTLHSSDDRLKRDEAFITNATDTLLKLKPQTYIKKHRLPENENDTDIPEQFEAGLIAQDVWYDAPELRFLVHPSKDANPSETKPVSPDPNDPTQDPDYSSWGTTQAYVNYEGFLPYLIKSNQEIYNELQAEKVVTTENKDLTRELRAENNRLKSKVTILENRQTHFNTLLVNLIGRVETLERPA